MSISEKYSKHFRNAGLDTSSQLFRSVVSDAKELEKEIETLKEGLGLYETYLKESPCDHDIYPEQLEAWSKLQEWKSKTQ